MGVTLLIDYLMFSSAVANVGLGIILYEVECKDLNSLTRSSILWVYVGYIVFQAVIQLTMILVFTISALKEKDRAGKSVLLIVYICVYVYFLHMMAVAIQETCQIIQLLSCISAIFCKWW